MVSCPYILQTLKYIEKKTHLVLSFDAFDFLDIWVLQLIYILVFLMCEDIMIDHQQQTMKTYIKRGDDIMIKHKMKYKNILNCLYITVREIATV